MARDRTPQLFVTRLVSGQDVGFRVAFGDPGAPVRLYASGRLGQGPCPPVLQGACFGIRAPQEIGSGVIGADGTIRFAVPIPASVAVGDRWAFQAAVDGELTPVVTRTIAAAGAAGPLGSNILIVLLDDVGTDKLAGWGSLAPAPTPNIDALAAQGVSFDNVYSRPVCGPTRASIQTGRHARRTGVGKNWNDAEAWELGLEQITLAELVELSPYFDYQTSFAGKWHLGSPLAPTGLVHPQAQGWDWFAGPYANLYRGTVHQYQSYYDWTKVENDGRTVRTSTYATTDTIDDAIARIGTMAEPWLMFVSLNAAHAPLEEPPSSLLPTVPAPGDGLATRKLLAAADTEIGRLLAAIPTDVSARTTTILLTDNGTMESEVQAPVRPTRGKGTLMDGGVRVPMVVAGAGVTAPGTRTAALVDVVDLFATVADIAGVDLQELAATGSALDAAVPYEVDGHSLLPLLQDPTLPGRRYAYSEMFAQAGAPPYLDYDRQMIRDRNHKLVVDNLTGVHRLYAYVPGAPDEGEDLLGCGTLAPAHQAAYTRLLAELAATTARLTYDAAPFPPPIASSAEKWPNDTAAATCTGDTGSPGGGDTGSGPTGDTGTAGDTGGP